MNVVLADGTSRVTPDITPRRTSARPSYINSATGFTPALSPEEIANLLKRMSLHATVDPSNVDEIIVDVPATRPDILHECDIMEDAAVAYGFNNLSKTFPRANTIARPLPINKLADIVRKECAMAGWVEVLPYILVSAIVRSSTPQGGSLSDPGLSRFLQCSHDENFAWLNRKDPGNYAVTLANPKTVEYQVVRTSLLPGLLKTVRENKKLPLPVSIFEVSDIAIVDMAQERRSRNIRKVSGVWSNKTAGFEVVHGLLDRIMQILGIPFIETKASTALTGYYIQATSGELLSSQTDKQ